MQMVIRNITFLGEQKRGSRCERWGNDFVIDCFMIVEHWKKYAFDSERLKSSIIFNFYFFKSDMSRKLTREENYINYEVMMTVHSRVKNAEHSCMHGFLPWLMHTLSSAEKGGRTGLFNLITFFPSISCSIEPYSYKLYMLLNVN